MEYDSSKDLINIFTTLDNKLNKEFEIGTKLFIDKKFHEYNRYCFHPIFKIYTKIKDLENSENIINIIKTSLNEIFDIKNKRLFFNVIDEIRFKNSLTNIHNHFMILFMIEEENNKHLMHIEHCILRTRWKNE